MMFLDGGASLHLYCNTFNATVIYMYDWKLRLKPQPVQQVRDVLNQDFENL